MQLGLFSDSLWSLVTGHRRHPAAAASHPAEPPSLYDRLRAAGLPAVPRFETHRNQQVMLSWLPGRRLRIHEGYAAAPEEVLRAIVKFLTPGVRRATRVAARQVFLSFPVERHAPPRPRRPPRPRPGDQELLLRLTTLQAELNLTHFGGQLATLPIRLSSRMRRRLGELRLERRSGRAVHIGLNRRHALRDPWPEVRDTLLHELVHQWQAETGRPVDHGREFRRMARAVGIVPRAVRTD